MKITPIDIQQMVFQVKFRGFDRDEVNRFLEELALTVDGEPRGSAVASAGLGEANSPAENQLIAEMMAPDAGVAPADIDQKPPMAMPISTRPAM